MVGKPKSYTFASAFENERYKPNEQNEACFGFVMASGRIKRTTLEANADRECSRRKQKRKSSLKKIYIKQRSSTRSKSVSRKTITFG